VFEFFGGQDIWDVFAESSDDVQLDWQWPPLVDALNGFLLDEVKSAIDNDTPLVDAYARVQASMVKEMEAKGLSVTEP
jgi:multiple sugar transport system substrate-binding protein